jgi:hypothetical protein
MEVTVWRPALVAILQFLIITTIAAAFARRILGKREPEFESAGERLVFESALGLGMLGLLIFALGALQLFYLPSFLLLLLGMAAVGWRELSGVISDITRGLRAIRTLRWRAETAAATAILASIGVLAIIRALAPPIGDDWDSLAYHLAMPKLFLKHHGIYYVPFASHSNFPFTWEMLYTMGLAFGSVSLAKLFHFGAGALLVVAVYSAGRRHFAPRTGALAALMIAGVPIAAWEATTAYVDLATALYSFLVVYSLLNFSATRDRRWAALAGVSAGLAAGTKMTALVMIAVAIVWILRMRNAECGMRNGECGVRNAERGVRNAECGMRNAGWRPALRTAAIAAGLALLLAAPWYVKTWIYTGNPVYPFFYGVFGGRNWSAETAALYRSDQLMFGMGHDPASLFMLPWNLTRHFARFGDYAARLNPSVDELPYFAGNPLVYLASIGPLFLALLPAIGFAALRPGRHRPMMAVTLALMLTWFFTMQNIRYLLPALALLAPAVAHSADLIGIRRAAFGVAAAAGAFTVLLMALFIRPAIPVAVGIEKPNDYLAGRFDVYRASEFVNENLPKHAKIALFGETRGFYLDRDYLWADPGHNALIPYRSMGSDPGRLLDWLESQCINYVLVNHANPGHVMLIDRAIGGRLEEIYSDPAQTISVYRIAR